MTDRPIYRLERRFNAPRALVWRAWTEPELLSRWYGPNVETTIHGFDPVAGGAWLTGMKMGEFSHFERCDFVEVVAPERLVFLQSMTDPEFAPVANPRMPDWPRVLKGSVTFADEGARTLMVFTWEPHDASAAENACFSAAMSGPQQGWVSGFDKLEQVLAEIAP